MSLLIVLFLCCCTDNMPRLMSCKIKDTGVELIIYSQSSQGHPGLANSQPNPRHVSEPTTPNVWQSLQISTCYYGFVVICYTALVWQQIANTSNFKITICDVLGKPLTFVSLSLSSCGIEIISSLSASSSYCLDQIRDYNTCVFSFQKGNAPNIVIIILLYSRNHTVLSPFLSSDNQKLLLIPCAYPGHFSLSYWTGGKLYKYTPSAEANHSCGVFPSSGRQWCFTMCWTCCQCQA